MLMENNNYLQVNEHGEKNFYYQSQLSLLDVHNFESTYLYLPKIGILNLYITNFVIYIICFAQ